MIKIVNISAFIIFISALMIPAISAFSQKLIYRIDYKNDSIGYMTAEKVLSNQKVTYELKTWTSFSLVLSFDHYAYYKAEYENNIMIDGISENFLNNKERSKTTITYKEGKYIIKKDEQAKIEDTPIHESIASLYFNEPGSNKIFSEKHGEFFSIKKVSSDKYELEKADDKINIYYFKNGICDKVEVNIALATVYLTRIK